MGEEGTEPSPVFPSETIPNTRQRTPGRTLDPDLARVVDAWDHLSDTRRSMIINLLRWHEKATRSDANPAESPAPWVARLREAKDLRQHGMADAALFETPDGQYEALGLDAINVADLAGLDLLGDGEPWRALCPGDRLGELLRLLTAQGQTVVVVDRLGEADRAAGRRYSRRVCRPADPDAEPDDSTEPERGWTHGDTPPALKLAQH